MAASVAYTPSYGRDASYYRPNTAYGPQQPVRLTADVRDDYERWYTESMPSNRMSLSLRSGILSEVSWALDRLCRLCHNEQFTLSAIPGLIDGLFDWPEWYLSEGCQASTDLQILFSAPREKALKRRFALESLFVLRNAALLEANSLDLANHTHTFPLILKTLLTLSHERDEDSEFVLHVIDLYHVFAAKIVIGLSTPIHENPLPLLEKIAHESTNRSMIIASLNALSSTLTNPANTVHLTPDAPAFRAAIRYLPLFIDKPLIEACLGYLYTHLSQLGLAKSFLLQSEMPGVLKLLVSVLHSEQCQLEEKVIVDVSGTAHTVPSTTVLTRDHELTSEEMTCLVSKSEPERCYDWMKTMFVAKPDGQLTQVDFWNLYKDAFTPYQELQPLLVASDVIKNVSTVFSQAQAMVLQGSVPKFVVRGVDRRKDPVVMERFKCGWDCGKCAHQAFAGPGELKEHLLEHLGKGDRGSELGCRWLTCSLKMQTEAHLRLHILTHLSSSQEATRPHSQSDTVTLSSADASYPVESPTSRPVPPLRSTVISYERPKEDPPSMALTALLCIRILYRTSFASSEAAPRVDAEHFGFPGVTADETGEETDAMDGKVEDIEREGERRGRKAFVGVRKMMEGVWMRDEVLNGWILEMADSSVPGAQ